MSNFTEHTNVNIIHKHATIDLCECNTKGTDRSRMSNVQYPDTTNIRHSAYGVAAFKNATGLNRLNLVYI